MVDIAAVNLQWNVLMIYSSNLSDTSFCVCSIDEETGSGRSPNLLGGTQLLPGWVWSRVHVCLISKPMLYSVVLSPLPIQTPQRDPALLCVRVTRGRIKKSRPTVPGSGSTVWAENVWDVGCSPHRSIDAACQRKWLWVSGEPCLSQSDLKALGRPIPPRLHTDQTSS